MSAPTQGPWEFTTRPDSGGASRPVVTKGLDLICAVSRRDGDERESEANAHLIAAAPELLEALRDVVAAFDAQVASYRANDDHAIADIAEQVHGARMDRARAAIAKAEGGR